MTGLYLSFHFNVASGGLIVLVLTAGQLAFAIPVAWLCAVVLDLGLPGAYLGLLAGWLARTAATYLRYRRRRPGSGDGWR